MRIVVLRHGRTVSRSAYIHHTPGTWLVSTLQTSKNANITKTMKIEPPILLTWAETDEFKVLVAKMIVAKRKAILIAEHVESYIRPIFDAVKWNIDWKWDGHEVGEIKSDKDLWKADRKQLAIYKERCQYLHRKYHSGRYSAGENNPAVIAKQEATEAEKEVIKAFGNVVRIDWTKLLYNHDQWNKAVELILEVWNQTISEDPDIVLRTIKQPKRKETVCQ